MDKINFDAKLQELNKQLSGYQLSFVQRQWINYLKWDGKSLSVKNIEFINRLIQEFNINKLDITIKNKIKILKQDHETTTIIFNSDKKKRWFVYLELDLNDTKETDIKTINELSKEELYPSELNKIEIIKLDQLINKYINKNNVNYSYQDKVKKLLMLPLMPADTRKKFQEYLEGKTCNFCGACEMCGYINNLYEFHYKN